MSRAFSYRNPEIDLAEYRSLKKEQQQLRLIHTEEQEPSIPDFLYALSTKIVIRTLLVFTLFLAAVLMHNYNVLG